MRFKSVAVPKASVGLTVSGPKITVPDQALSLSDIIKRFVRGEKLPVDMGGEYILTDDDLEKVKDMDLTEKEEFIERQRRIQKAFQDQEKYKERKRLEKLREEEREKIRQELAEKAKAEVAGKTP